MFDTLPNIIMTISQYDQNDHEIDQYTGTFLSVFNAIPNFEEYCYRVTALGKKDLLGRVVTNHFGVKTTSIGGFKVSEESYINSLLNHYVAKYFEHKSQGIVNEEQFNFANLIVHDFWFIDQMRTMRQNTSKEFNVALNSFLHKFKQFIPVENLNDVKEKSGIYLLVLDEYNICYLGQADDIRRRVMRHWSRNDYFNGTGIDLFKAKDTTRIYVALTDTRRRINIFEHQAIDQMPSRYTLNCLSGGDIDFLAKNSFSLLKKPCSDKGFVNYRRQYYNVVERIESCKERFVVENVSSVCQ